MASSSSSSSRRLVSSRDAARFGGGRTNGNGNGSSNGSGNGSTSISTSNNLVGSLVDGMRAANHINSVVDEWPMYSSQPDDYDLGDIIGLGASSIVYQAAFHPLQGRACAVKVIDLEAFGRDTDELRRETQLMSLSKHPNVLRVRGCWVVGSKLHIATRLMNSGSLLDIMRFGYQDGLSEDVICAILKQALQGLAYLHVNGWLHRDLKSANLLVDDDGTVLLGDFGVGAMMGDNDAKTSKGKRKSFVGTPCWMAPEVVERRHYDSKADIWSFGITALELSQGHAPHSRLPPVKVLLKTLSEDPPQLDRTGGAHKYSKQFDDFIRSCLQKDPEKRPTAERLLKHPFLKGAKPPRHLASTILVNLPPLAERQENRRRAMSMASLRAGQSWDFGASPPASLRVKTDGGGDPFAGFTDNITSPGPSPWNSLKRPGVPRPASATTLVSIDGEHAIAVQGSDDEADASAPTQPHPLLSRFQPPTGPLSLMSPSPTTSSISMRRRKSVSFDASAGPEETGFPTSRSDGLENIDEAPAAGGTTTSDSPSTSATTSTDTTATTQHTVEDEQKEKLEKLRIA
ncbi:kinase-like protein [Jaminaea rosea]|uniref:Kinase-like protein n=1 Tax=Jaminaea rosea TaxID=1569628 RepID=A0A316UPR2_9BASI|nr:kinase-like protein [Jaminaea rosea]PWN25863.1 kinase-like protein [Jaminaea rosea]